MAVYMFKCVPCGTIQDETRAFGDTEAPTHECGRQMVRAWNEEVRTQETHIPMHMSARNTTNKSDFLPDNKFFESPSDPTGENGMNKWKKEHTTKNFREI